MVTIKQVQDRIDTKEYIMSDRSSIVILTMKCGHKIVGEAHCQPDTLYDADIGRETALNDAMDKAFDLEVYYDRNICREHPCT